MFAQVPHSVLRASVPGFSRTPLEMQLRTPQRIFRLRAPDHAALHRWQAALTRSDGRQSGPMAGFLEKRGRNQLWQKRWFIVHRGAL